MLRISKLTDYATVVLAEMARDPDRVFTTAELAAQTRVAAPTVSKLLKALGRDELVASFRGAHGGYQLARSPEAISVADIIEAIEGPVSITECTRTDSQCELEAVCSIGSNWQKINRAIQGALEDLTLARLAEPVEPPGQQLFDPALLRQDRRI